MRFDGVYDAAPVIFRSLAVRFDGVYDAVPVVFRSWATRLHSRKGRK